MLLPSVRFEIGAFGGRRFDRSFSLQRRMNSVRVEVVLETGQLQFQIRGCPEQQLV
jgi:hypothetical protein